MCYIICVPGSYYCVCDPGYVKDYTGQCRGRCAICVPGSNYTVHVIKAMLKTTQASIEVGVPYVYPGRTTLHVTQAMLRTTQASVEVGVLCVYQDRTTLHVTQAILRTTQASVDACVLKFVYKGRITVHVF